MKKILFISTLALPIYAHADTPIESDAKISPDVPITTAQGLGKVVREFQYSCRSISAVQKYPLSAMKFRVTCDRWQNSYDVELSHGRFNVKPR